MLRTMLAMAAVLIGGWALADEKKPDDKPAEKAELPTGVWTKKADDGLTIQLDFSTKDVLVVTTEVEKASLTITCKLEAGKDGTFKAKATKVTNKDFPVEVSDKYEFSFKVKVDKEKATVSDFKANEHEEHAKGVVEGEYKKKESK